MRVVRSKPRNVRLTSLAKVKGVAMTISMQTMRELEAALGLEGTRKSLVEQYAVLYAEYQRTRLELMAAIDYMRQTGNAPDVLQRRGG